MKGILLVNLGTPEAPTKGAVKRYLTEFLTDPKVIDMHWLKRQLLVRGAIIPRRICQTLQSYQTIWTKEGSPLLVHSLDTKRRLQHEMGSNDLVEIAMRYQSPSIQEGLNKLLSYPLKELVILPLFPQYASATTGSIFEKVVKELSLYRSLPKITFIDQFHDHPAFIEAFKAVSAPFPVKAYDHVLFSFHGLPKRQSANYDTQCYKTASLIAHDLDLSRYSVTFQSRLGKDPWLEPYTNDTIEALAKQGAKKILVFSPSFVTDCLETLFEIGIEYKELFHQKGGETLDLVPGLNSHPAWIDALKKILEYPHTC